MRAAVRGDRSGRAPGRRRSEAALGTQPIQASTSADLVALQGLLAAFEAHGSALAWAIDLAADVACDAGEPTGHLPATLRAMSRYLDFAYLAKTTDRPQLDAMIEGRTNTRMAEPPSPSGNLTSVRAWRKWLEERPGRSPSPNLDALVEEAWPRWEGRIARLFDGVTTLDTHIFYDDLVLAAADRMPSRVMRADLRQMKPIDWSELALFGSNSRPPAATSPHWSLLAGLRQLGFGGNLLAEILRVFALDVDILPSPNPDWTIRMAQEAPLAEPGILIIIGNGDEPLERDDRAPYLVLREARAEEYHAGVEWLDRLGAFGILLDER